MASVTICSDFGAPQNKVWHCFHCFPIYFPWSDGTRCHDLRFLNIENIQYSLRILIANLYWAVTLCWVRHDWATSLSLFNFMHWRRKWQPTPVFLSGESQGRVARWAAVYGVTQSRTRLKLLSSSSRYLIILFSPVYSKKLSYFHISIVAFPFCFITINSSGFLSLIWGLNRSSSQGNFWCCLHHQLLLC